MLYDAALTLARESRSRQSTCFRRWSPGDAAWLWWTRTRCSRSGCRTPRDIWRIHKFELFGSSWQVERQHYTGFDTHDGQSGVNTEGRTACLCDYESEVATAIAGTQKTNFSILSIGLKQQKDTDEYLIFAPWVRISRPLVILTDVSSPNAHDIHTAEQLPWSSRIVSDVMGYQSEQLTG